MDHPSYLEFLMGLAAGQLPGIAKWTSAKVADQLYASGVAPRLQSWFNRAMTDTFGPGREVRELFSALFLNDQQKIYLIPAQHNPGYVPAPAELAMDATQLFTRTTFESACAFGAVLESEDHVSRVDEILLLGGEGNLIAFGSPTSNLVARIAMGYTPIQDDPVRNKRGDLRHVASDAVHFKLLYELDGEAIANSSSSHRYLVPRQVRGSQSEVPNWGIRRSGGEVQCPELRDGALVQDYLLITSIPNAFSRSSLDAGLRITSFGGTHREGTAAVKQLLTSRVLLEDLQKRIGALATSGNPKPYWQALIGVRCGPDTEPTPHNVISVDEVETNDGLLRTIAEANGRAG